MIEFRKKRSIYHIIASSEIGSYSVINRSFTSYQHLNDTEEVPEDD